MQKIKSLVLLFLPVLAILSSCQGRGGDPVLKGTIQNAGSLQVTLDQAHFDRTNVSLGRATCDANGSFEIKPEKPFEEGLYRLSIGAKRLYFILNGKEGTIDIKGDLSTIDKMEVQVTGSETFTCYAKIIQDLLKTPLKSPEEAKAAAQKGCTPLMQAFLVTQLLGQNATSFIEDFKAAGKKLDESMPGSKYSTDYAKMITQISAPAPQGATGATGGELVQVGQDAPNISLPGPDGKVHSLAALKGKIVLLDFWASWCGPCRRENPHVVEVYNKFKDKGFEIFSVSLDGADPRMKLTPDQMLERQKDGKEKWIAAIKQDGLIWDNHVSDLKHWASDAAALYGVNSIPKTFLIGRDGKVIAINPRQNLEQELLKVL